MSIYVSMCVQREEWESACACACVCVCLWGGGLGSMGSQRHTKLTQTVSLQSLQSNLTVNACLISLPRSLLDTVMKSCTYKAFCDKAHGSNSGAKMDCCFGDDCNGPHRSHSHGHRNSAGALTSSSIILMTALLLHMAVSHL